VAQGGEAGTTDDGGQGELGQHRAQASAAASYAAAGEL
jgi:hypothetical protein